MRFHSLVLLLSVASTGAAQSVQLRYDPPVGTTRTYKMAMNMTMSMGGAAGSKPMAMNQTAPMKIRVVSRTADSTTIETTSGPFKSVAGSSTPLPGQAVKPQVFRMTMDRFGTPKGATGAGAAPAMLGSMGQSIQGVVFPKKAVRVGEAWSQTVDMGKVMSKGPSQMKGTMPITYRLVSLANGTATVAMTSKANLTMNMGGRPMNLAMDIKGTILLDAATGLTKSMTSTTDSNTQMPGMGTMRQRMVMTMK